jgi:hypothetical protein
MSWNIWKQIYNILKPIEYSITNSKKEVYSNECLLKKKKKAERAQITYHYTSKSKNYNKSNPKLEEKE